MQRNSWLLLGVLAALWGASYLFIKIGLEDLSPAMVVCVRTALGALVLLPLAARRGGLARLRGLVGPVAALAAIQVAGPFLLISEGERWIASSLAGILVASAPIFTALIALALTGEERANGWSAGGLSLGLGGVALLLGVDAGGSGMAVLGASFVLLAGLGYAIGGFIVKRGLGQIDPVWLVAATMGASAILTLPFAAATFPGHLPRAGVWAAMTVLGAGGTGLAFAIFYTLIQREGPSRAAVVAYIAPAFAVIYGVALRGEAFRPSTAVGLVAILAGSWLAAEAAPPWRRAAAGPLVEPKTPETAAIVPPRQMFDSPHSSIARTEGRHR